MGSIDDTVLPLVRELVTIPLLVIEAMGDVCQIFHPFQLPQSGGFLLGVCIEAFEVVLTGTGFHFVGAGGTEVILNNKARRRFSTLR